MRSRKDRLLAILVLLPSLVLLGIFVYGFIGQTLYVSTTDWGSGAHAALAVNPELHPVGLANYRQLFTGFLDVRFRQDLVNMVFFTLLFVSASLCLGLLFATLLDQHIRGEGLFRTIFLFPMSLSFVVTGTIWRWLLQPQGGVNALPTLIGLPPGHFLWLSERAQVLVFNLKVLSFPEPHGLSLGLLGVVLAATWQMAGYTMALYLAGLRTIPDELREAARVDGANRWQVYRHVELPLLKPITWSAIIILGHIALKIFDLVLAMAGTDNAPTSVPAISMYLTTFRGNQFAKGAAIAVVLLALVSLLIIPYLVTSLNPRSSS